MLQMTHLKLLSLQGFLQMPCAVMSYALACLTGLTQLELQHNGAGSVYTCDRTIIPPWPHMQVG